MHGFLALIQCVVGIYARSANMLNQEQAFKMEQGYQAFFCPILLQETAYETLSRCRLLAKSLLDKANQRNRIFSK